ncbi:MAG: ABC transporter permease [Novosphingobium sp.]
MAVLTVPGRAHRAAKSRVAATSRTRYVLTRLWQSLLAIFLVYVVIFVIVTVLPGNPVQARMTDPNQGYTQEEINALLSYYHLDRGVWEQLYYSLKALVLHWDWGLSLETGQPVWNQVVTGIPSTLALAGAAFVIAVALAFGISLSAVYLPARLGGSVLRSLPSLFLSAPNFILALVVIYYFSFRLGWFEVTDYAGWRSLVYPAITLAIPVSAPIAQVLISALDTARAEQYSTVALSKGSSRFQLLTRHWLPNASLPTLTISALIVGELLGGSVITESVYGRTGVGTVIEAAATTQDVPVLQAVVTLAAAVFLIINLIVDLIYPSLDPRIGKAGAAR